MAQVKVIKQTDPELADMFNKLVGVENADTNVIIPKCNDVNTRFKKIASLLEKFGKFEALINIFPANKYWFDDIVSFALEVKNAVLPEDIKIDEKSVHTEYKKFKDGEMTRKLCVVCGNLKPYYVYIADKNNPDDKFIVREPGVSFAPFFFSDFDLKIIWSTDDVSQAVKKYILGILRVIYEETFAIYDITTSPDIDTAEFAAVLLRNIGMLRKKIPRCDDAFNRIEKSLEMLKGNFKSYYRDFVASKNPSIIMENFVADVAKQQSDITPKLTFQFRRIVQYYHEATGNRPKDPRMTGILNMLNDNLNQLDNSLKNKKSSD